MIKQAYKFIRKITPYWLAHAIVALLISWVFGYWLAGTLFYTGREYTQYEFRHELKKEDKFDWPGLIAPLIANSLMLFI